MAEASPARGVKRSLSCTDKEQTQLQKPFSIVLTGGPCAGKSSILAVIRDRLRKRGMQVVTVPEYATHFFANSDGFQLEWIGTQKEQNLQNVFLSYQMNQEDMFRDYASLNSKPSVLLLDRAAIDQSAHTSKDIWQGALQHCKVTEHELLDRYDVVIHLGTCAKVGEYEWGPGSNNPGRYHSPEEAAELDHVCESAYKNHKQFRHVPHFEKFQEKVDQVMKYLEDALGVDGLAGKRQRISVRFAAEAVPADVIAQCQAFEVTSTYLDDSMEVSVQRRLRVPVEDWLAGLRREASRSSKLPSSSSHIDQIFEERRSIPADKFLARRVLTDVVYHHQVRLARHESVTKHVITFQTPQHHYELLYFQDNGELDLVLDFTVGAALPSWLVALGDAEPQPSGKPTGTSPVKAGRKVRKLDRHSTAEAAEAQWLRCSMVGC